MIIFGTFAVVLVTLVGVIWTNMNTKKSIDLSRKEQEYRLRPWIITDTIDREVNNETIQDFVEDYANSITLNFINNGPVPAKNVVAKKFLKKITDNYYPIPSTEELQSFPSTNPIELGPHERHFEDLFFKDFSIPVNDENEINVRGIQFGIRIDYEDQNNNPHFYEVWGHFDKYEYTIIDSSKME